MTDEKRRKLEEEDLETGLRAAFDRDSDTSKSVLARIEDRGQQAPRVVLRDVPDEITPVIRPGAPDAKHASARYQIAGEIARGGVGVVLRGRDVDLGREVAMKVLLERHADKPELVERFVEEAQIGGQLQHPGIVPVYELGLQADGRPYFAMKLVKGKTLAALLAKQTDVARDRGRVLSIFERACQTVAYAHARGVIHRDLKPSNIMTGSYGEVQVVDWGFAKVLTHGGLDDERRTEDAKPDLTVVATVRSASDSSTSVVGSVMGTPAYMPPEQAMGEVEKMDERSDVFSLGAILCEILTGQPPYTGDDLLAQAAQAKLDPAHARLDACAADRELVELAKRCLTPARAMRPADAGEVAAAVSAHQNAVEERAREAEVRAVRARGRALLAAVALFVGLGIVAALYGRRVMNERAVGNHLATAERALDAGNHDAALAAVARALERDADSAAARDVRARVEAARGEKQRAADYAQADAARVEAAHKQATYLKLRAQRDALVGEAATEREACFSQHASTDRRAALARLETRAEEMGQRCELLLREAHEALERAQRFEARWGDMRAETRAAVADFLALRFRHDLTAAPRGRQEQVARAHRSAMEPYDPDGRYRAELLGRGSLTVAVTPADADVYLFRYEGYETVRTDRAVIPRLVPVPTTGVGRCRNGAWGGDFHPGDRCLRITKVDAGSRAARAGLRAGDLVVRVNGDPAHGLFVAGVIEGGLAAKAGLKAPVRIDRLNGERAPGWYEMRNLQAMMRRGRPRTMEAGGVKVSAEGSTPFGTRLAPVEVLVAGPAPPGGVTLACLQSGALVTLEIPEGETAGVACDPTAYPLVLAPENRLAAGGPVEIDAGSYLLYARRTGFEDQRYPVVVPRGGNIDATIELLPAGTTPPGFVHVPGGPFVFGGDPDGRGAPWQVAELPGFFIAREEITLAEWTEFLNDPETRKLIDAPDDLGLLPRIDGRGRSLDLVVPAEDGRLAHRTGLDPVPVGFISNRAVQEFVAWRNRKARENSEPWTYELPTIQEWQKAGRGADGRLYPWGDRADYGLCVSMHYKPGSAPFLPSKCEPADESPFGVSDMAGSRAEPLQDRPDMIGHTGAGGSAVLPIEAARLTWWEWSGAPNQRFSSGVRLVARPRE